MKVLVTGAAGFIGSFTTHRLLDRGDEVIGLDNVNDYYDPTLKEARLERIQSRPDADRFRFIKADLADREAMDAAFANGGFDRVVHLAAQAGVRYSLECPHVYTESNITGFLHVLEGCRHHGIEHLVYASTSSVYGSDTGMPFTEHKGADHPITLYAATKRANEMMAHSYSSLFDLPTTGLRFFTVYGPWGRPDMALFLFAKAILAGKPIDVFNHGKHKRDFTYVEDIVEGIVRVLDQPAAPASDYDTDHPDPAVSHAPWRIYNIGNSQPVELMHYIEVLEDCLGRKAEKNMLPMQPGDIPATWADTSDLANNLDYKPATSVEQGVRNFVDWYLSYYEA
ncbi:MAG: capsular biosynthesis protein CpsI [Phycisphaerae bacterium]|nr:capsular biosynthesis protein CpsI [Phycisphaerae bacterium]|tara:strand:+ start:353 stop:1369 length:1017 start_codon:yes stop_codon:yes gene_type:complete